MLVAIVLGVGSLAFLLWALVRSVQVERSAERSLWREFGLGLALMALFFATWIAHGIAEWQTYTDQQHEHGEPVTAGDFLSEFGQSTLENWQSEFLQLFAFVTLAALYIHKGSAESKDGEETSRPRSGGSRSGSGRCRPTRQAVRTAGDFPTPHRGAETFALRTTPGALRLRARRRRSCTKRPRRPGSRGVRR
jgi:hypothetical protein